MLLEVIVQSVGDARAAAAGGADRLEVVREIARGGLTPDPELVRAIAAETNLPLRVMIRERDSFSVADARELAALQRAVASCAALGVDGIVLGFASGGAIDLGTTSAVLATAPGLLATFHRAFDEAADPAGAIDALRELPQVDRILTTGGPGTWTARRDALRRYAARAAGRLTILAGGGIDVEALTLLASSGCVQEAHVGRAACDPPVSGAPVSSDRVRRLKRAAASSR
jgi:copper homeostasis protein